METTINKREKETGSFFNMLMGNNNSVPIVGKGATILHWTDRRAYEVIQVDEIKKTCTLQRYNPERIDSNGMSDSQAYKYEILTTELMHLVYRQKAWRRISETIVFTEKFKSKLPDGYSYREALTPGQRDAIYAGEVCPQNILEGITRKKTTYSKVNVIFGVKEEYYDFSF